MVDAEGVGNFFSPHLLAALAANLNGFNWLVGLEVPLLGDGDVEQRVVFVLSQALVLQAQSMRKLLQPLDILWRHTKLILCEAPLLSQDAVKALSLLPHSRHVTHGHSPCLQVQFDLLQSREHLPEDPLLEILAVDAPAFEHEQGCFSLMPM